MTDREHAQSSFGKNADTSWISRALYPTLCMSTPAITISMPLVSRIIVGVVSSAKLPATAHVISRCVVQMMVGSLLF